MKHLFLLRHAKSSWDHPGLADFDRPLNERGQKAAPKMGKVIVEKKVKPEIILCSPAKRTIETAKLVLESSKLKTDITYEKRIYDASTRTLIDILKSQNSDIASILLIGHNPGMSDLLTELTGESEHFPTAALAMIQLKIESWNRIKDGAGSLNWILRPRELK
ncbi:MAG: histidine phosphatase family protein [Candidatus Obscuribacterales bacterium]|nr:histidine phosphatase family protein [Candidatus Obscuribacterales bacterium]